MSTTKVKVPESLVKRVDALGPHFVLVYSQHKPHPDPEQPWAKRPVGFNWNTKDNLYLSNDPKLLNWLDERGNYGICGGFGLVILDADTPEIKEIVQDKLPETFTVESPGSHGWHCYFLCGLENPIRLRDKNDKGEMVNVGDIQGPGKMVLGPNSVHPNGKTYKVVKDLPFAQVTKEQLTDALKDYVVPERKIMQIEGMARSEKSFGVDLNITQVVPLSGLTLRGGEYYGPHPLHGSTTGQNFHVNPRKNCWYCFRHDSGGGPLHYLAMESGILDCAECQPGMLRGSNFKQVLDVAVEKGYINRTPLLKHIETGEHVRFYIEGNNKVKVMGVKDGKTVTSEVTLDDPEKLSTSKRAKRIRDHLKEQVGDNYPKELDKIVMKMQNAIQELESKTEQTVEELNFSDEDIRRAEKILQEDPFEYFLKQAKKLHAGDEDLLKAEWISALSGAVCDLPINLWTIGQSGKGKTHSKYTIITILPKELYLVFTSASPLSLFYYIKAQGEDALDGVLLFIDEVEASRFAMPMLRTLTSQTPILPRHLSVHEAEVLDLKIVGKRAVWFTSVKTFGTEQIKNRFIHVNPDETTEQDDRVFQLQDSIYRKNSKKLTDFSIMKAVAHLIVRDTKDVDVIIPYEIDWPFKERRWLYPIFLSFIKTVTKIHYLKRERDGNGNLKTTEADFNLAKELWKSFEDTIAKRVTGSARQVLDALAEDKTLAKTHSELSDDLPLGTRQIGNLCEELLEEGLVNRQKREVEKGRPSWEYWKTKQPGIKDIKLVETETFGNNEMTDHSHIPKTENDMCESSPISEIPKIPTLQETLVLLRSTWQRGYTADFDKLIVQVKGCSLEEAEAIREKLIEEGSLAYDNEGFLCWV